jgi:hypothetical protein
MPIETEAADKHIQSAQRSEFRQFESRDFPLHAIPTIETVRCDEDHRAVASGKNAESQTTRNADASA